VRCINPAGADEAAAASAALQPGARLFAPDQRAARATSLQQKQLQQMRQAALRLRERGVGFDPAEWGGRKDDPLYMLTAVAGATPALPAHAQAAHTQLHQHPQQMRAGQLQQQQQQQRAGSQPAAVVAEPSPLGAVVDAGRRPGAGAVGGAGGGAGADELMLDAADWDAVQAREGRVANALTRKLRTLALRAGVSGGGYLPHGGSVASAAEALAWAQSTTGTERQARRRIKELEHQRQVVQSKDAQSAQSYI
jgi:hypothetical protein